MVAGYFLEGNGYWSVHHDAAVGWLQMGFDGADSRRDGVMDHHVYQVLNHRLPVSLNVLDHHS